MNPFLVFSFFASFFIGGFLSYIFLKKKLDLLQMKFDEMNKNFISNIEELKKKEQEILTSFAEKNSLDKENALNKQENINLKNQLFKQEQEQEILNQQKETHLEKINQLKQEETKLTTLKVENENTIRDLKQELSDIKGQLTQAFEKISNYQLSQKENQTYIKAQQEKLSQLKDDFNLQKESLKSEFSLLAKDALKNQQEELGKNNQANINGILEPLNTKISNFEKRVNEIHDATTKGNTNLENQIKNIKDLGIKMQEDANNLTNALKGDSQQRGAWGETQLERTLEMSGLIAKEHFEKQTSFKDETGKTKITDYLIKMPNNKNLIIDSKVSLISYDKLISSKNKEEEKQALKEHANSIKKHINDLSTKDYASLNELNSPDFVLMFMPIEAAYIEALKENKDLFSYGYEKNIILVSHTTLVPILRTVANLWMLDKSNKEAHQISQKAGDIYNTVCLLATRFTKLGATLKAASNQYNDTVKTISGNQGLYGKVNRFKLVAKKGAKSLINIEENHLEFDTEKCEAIALDEQISIE